MLIGREKEIQELRQAYDSAESKFVAIYNPQNETCKVCRTKCAEIKTKRA